MNAITTSWFANWFSGLFPMLFKNITIKNDILSDKTYLQEIENASLHTL